MVKLRSRGLTPVTDVMPEPLVDLDTLAYDSTLAIKPRTKRNAQTMTNAR
jgi:hypothetical protein